MLNFSLKAGWKWRVYPPALKLAKTNQASYLQGFMWYKEVWIMLLAERFWCWANYQGALRLGSIFFLKRLVHSRFQQAAPPERYGFFLLHFYKQSAPNGAFFMGVRVFLISVTEEPPVYRIMEYLEFWRSVGAAWAFEPALLSSAEKSQPPADILMILGYAKAFSPAPIFPAAS